MPLEVAITKYWANLGDMVVDYTIELHGLRPDCGRRLVLGAGEGLRCVLLGALAQEDVQPQAQLKHIEPVVRSVPTPPTTTHPPPPHRRHTRSMSKIDL